MARKIAVVTGANKGIGLAIVKGLCERFNGDVYLTSRNEERGQEAVKQLKELGLKVMFHQLDIADRNSVKKFHDHIRSKYGGFDILVNNAAIAFNKNSTETLLQQAEQTIFMNYHSFAMTCEILFPLLRPRGRVINVSSAVGHPSFIPGENVRAKFLDKSLTEMRLNKLVNDFVKSVRRETNEIDGWGKNSYIVSKIGMCALTFIHDKMYHSKGISINCYHPGFISTDLSSHRGSMTVEEGASTALYLALEAPERLSGKFLWSDSTIVDWFAPLPCDLYAPYTNCFNEPLPVELQEIKSTAPNHLNKDNLNHHISNVTNEIPVQEEVNEILFEEKSSLFDEVTASAENIEEHVQEVNGDEQSSAVNQGCDESSFILSEEQSLPMEYVKTTENPIIPSETVLPHKESVDEFPQNDDSNQPSVEDSQEENYSGTKNGDRPVANSLADDDLINLKTK